MPIETVAVEQRFEGDNGMSHVGIEEKNVLVRGDG